MHGTRIMSWGEVRQVYGRELINLRQENRFVFLNTLFSVSEGVMYMQVSSMPHSFMAWMMHWGWLHPRTPSIRAIRSSDSGWADNGNQKSAVDNMMASGGKPNTGTTTLRNIPSHHIISLLLSHFFNFTTGWDLGSLAR